MPKTPHPLPADLSEHWRTNSRRVAYQTPQERAERQGGLCAATARFGSHGDDWAARERVWLGVLIAVNERREREAARSRERPLLNLYFHQPGGSPSGRPVRVGGRPFGSITEAASFHGLNRSQLQTYLKRGSPRLRGLEIRWADEPPRANGKKRSVAIVQGGEGQWSSLADAARALGMKITTLGSAVQRGSLVAGRYRLEYVDSRGGKKTSDVYPRKSLVHNRPGVKRAGCESRPVSSFVPAEKDGRAA